MRWRGYIVWQLRLLVIAGLFVCILPHFPHDAAPSLPKMTQSLNSWHTPISLRGGCGAEDTAPAPAQLARTAAPVAISAESRQGAMDRTFPALRDPALAQPLHRPPGTSAPAVMRPATGHLNPALSGPHHGRISPFGPAGASWSPDPAQRTHVEQSQADFHWRMQRRAHGHDGYDTSNAPYAPFDRSAAGGLHAYTPSRSPAYGYGRGAPSAHSGGDRNLLYTVRVALPAGATPGQQMPINIPGRGVVVVTVPANARAGQDIDVSFPVHNSPGALAAAAAPGAPLPQRASGNQHFQIPDLGVTAGMDPSDQRVQHSQRQELKSVSIVLPENCIPGQQLQVLADADTVMFTVPPGAVPGQRITVRYLPSMQQHHVAYSHHRPWQSAAGYPLSRYVRDTHANDWGAVRHRQDDGRDDKLPYLSPRRPGRPPGALNLSNRPPVVSPPALPPLPQQLTRRMVLMHTQRDQAVQLAAQYNASLFIINSDALDPGVVRISVPQGRVGRRPAYRGDPQMMLIWHLSSQIPIRAIVLVDVYDKGVAERIARTLQYQARQNVRQCLSWQPLQTYTRTIRSIRTSASGQKPIWRFQNDRWGYHDADTGQYIEEPAERVNRSVLCFLPSLRDPHQWVQVGAGLQWLSLDISVKPLPPFQVFRAAVKPKLAHKLAERRDRERQQQERVAALMDEIGNATLVLSLVNNITMESRAEDLAKSEQPSAMGIEGRVRRRAGPEAYSSIAAACASYVSVRGCFYNNGWNVAISQMENVHIDWDRACESLNAIIIRLKSSLKEATDALAVCSVSSEFAAGAIGPKAPLRDHAALAGEMEAGRDRADGSRKMAEQALCEESEQKGDDDSERRGEDQLTAEERQSGSGCTRLMSDRHVVERLLREEWKGLSNESRAVYESVSATLATKFSEALELRQQEERRRRQESFSMELCGPSRRSTYTSLQSGGMEVNQYVWGTPREVPASTRKMRGSWRATCLFAVIQLNASSPESAVMKKDIVEWIHKAKPEVMNGAEPFYLGIHLSNLVRDGILASFQPVREMWEESGFGKGRQAHMYYAVEGAGDKLDHSDPWPTVRGAESAGRRGRVPRSRLGADADLASSGHAGQNDNSMSFGTSFRGRRAVDGRVGAGTAGGATGKGYGAGEGGLTIRQTQAALLRRVEVGRGRRAEFVLNRWEYFEPFFEAADRDLANGPLARKLHHLRQSSLEAESARVGMGLEVGAEEVGALGRPEALLPVRGQPACIHQGEMREYQVEGLKWMVAQHDQAAGGILGDEMGLGKTLQVISFLGFLKTVRKEQGPHLVVAPLSVMNNWLLEAAKWCPALRIITFHGSVHERERLRHDVLHKGNYDLCLTTYEMLVADLHGFVARSVWNYVIMDEAHRIKNENTQLGNAVRRLRCTHRFLITGTPLQNNMHELWSLLNILFPEALSSSSMFDQGFRIEELYTNASDPRTVMDARLMECAHTLLRPLMLRRLKRDVLSAELPPKIEKKIIVPLSSMQRFLYSGILQQDLSSVILPAGAGSGPKVRDWSKLNSLVMQLRKVCNHPYLFPEMDPMETDERMVNASNKLLVLDKILAKLRREGRKALIYSQFTSMLDVIADFLSFRGYRHLRLDGSTPAARRRFEIASFENPRSPYFVYLISTRAGGLGITLVAADTVILYDSDWNPSADMQAMDRVHRIGQKKPVHCYRLCTKGTVEERILAAAQQKTIMNALVMQDNGGPNQNAYGSGGREQHKDVSMRDLVSALREGVKCVAFKEQSADGWENLSIDEILERAETKVASGGPPQDGEEQADKSLGADAGAPAAIADNSSAVKLAGSETMAEEQAGVTADKHKEDGGLGDLQKEDDGLGDLFQTLPAIRKFEGKHYKSRKEGVRDLATQWADSVGEGSKRQSKQRVINVNGHDVIAWSLDNKDRANSAEGGAGGAGRRAASAAASAGRRGETAMKHRRRCQRCKRSVGEFLFCSKCPCIMHKFCVRAEGWGEFDDSSSDSAADAGAMGEVVAERGGEHGYDDDKDIQVWESEEEEEEEGSDSEFRSHYARPKGSVGTRQGLRQRNHQRPPQLSLPQNPSGGLDNQNSGHKGNIEAWAAAGAKSGSQHTEESASRLAPGSSQSGAGEDKFEHEQVGRSEAQGGDAAALAHRAAVAADGRRETAPLPAPQATREQHTPKSDASSPSIVRAAASSGDAGASNKGNPPPQDDGRLSAGLVGRLDPAAEVKVGLNSSEIGLEYDGRDEGGGARAGKRHSEMRELLARDPDWRLFAKILDSLLKKREGQHFQSPAIEQLPVEEHSNYTRVVTKPLDLGCVHRRFRDGYYTRMWQLGADIRQVFTNAISYHTSEHPTYKAARRLRKYFSDTCEELGLELQQEGTVGEWPHDYLMYLKRMLKMKDAAAFLRPVDTEAVPDYLSTIARPMSLDTVAARLHNGTYLDATEMAQDIRLTLDNAMTYNPKKHPFHTAAKRLLKSFEDQFAKLQLPRSNLQQPRASPPASAKNKTASAKMRRCWSGGEGATGGKGKKSWLVPLRRSSMRWLCPHHRCIHSNRPASDCGGMLFRCFDCPAAFSDEYLQDGFEPLEVTQAFSPLNYAPPSSAEYIRCAKCVAANGNASLEPQPEDAAEQPSSCDDDAGAAASGAAQGLSDASAVSGRRVGTNQSAGTKGRRAATGKALGEKARGNEGPERAAKKMRINEQSVSSRGQSVAGYLEDSTSADGGKSSGSEWLRVEEDTGEKDDAAEWGKADSGSERKGAQKSVRVKKTAGKASKAKAASHTAMRSSPRRTK